VLDYVFVEKSLVHYNTMDMFGNANHEKVYNYFTFLKILLRLSDDICELLWNLYER